MAARKINKSNRRQIIDKANANVVVAVSISVFILMFSLFALKALISESLYHGRVIKEKKVALSVLEKNASAVKDLEKVYIAFTSEEVNVINGNANGSGPRDGSNSKLVLDALPAEYDFPALSTSLEKILTDGGYSITSLGGQETIAGSDTGEEPTVNVTTPLEIPYPINVRASAAPPKLLLQTLQRSIRPFYVDSLSFQGSSDSLDVNLTLRTFYQPSIGLQISTKVVK